MITEGREQACALPPTYYESAYIILLVVAVSEEEEDWRYPAFLPDLGSIV